MAAAQWVRALAPKAEGWVFESQPQLVVKTGIDSLTAKRSAISVSEMTIINGRMPRITVDVAR